MHETCIPCTVYNFLYIISRKGCEFLRFYMPIISSFLYVTLLVFPWLAEIMILYQSNSASSFVNTILFCSTVQTGLSISSALNMGYNFFCCCADSRLTDADLDKIINCSADRMWCSSPMRMKSLVSPGYIIYLGVPWLLVNIIALKFLPNDMCFPPVLFLTPFIPLLVYLPFFAVGSAYRNIMESSKLDHKLKESTSALQAEAKSLSGSLVPLAELNVKCDTKHIDITCISSVSCTSEHTEPLKSVPNTQQLYDTKPLKFCDVQGASSRAIFNFMKCGNKALCDNPIDVDDFERNRALLLHYPEWRERILEMGEISNDWKILSANWTQIEILYEKDYLIHRKLNPEGECDNYIRKLLKDV
jgi:hypothetical protein